VVRSGRLGNGLQVKTSTPVDVLGIDGTSDAVDLLAIGEAHSCVSMMSEKVLCWGNNDRGQLGDGTKTQRSSPVELSQSLGGPVETLALGQYASCAKMRATLFVKCWGHNGFSVVTADGTTADKPSPFTQDLGGPVRLLRLAGERICVTLVDGPLKCWGINEVGYPRTGNVGEGTKTAVTTPTEIRVDGPVARLELGALNALAILDDGTLKGWGYNAYGQALFDGTTAEALTPTTAGSMGGAIATFAIGDYMGCAFLTTNVLKCYGRGIIGDGQDRRTQATPAVVRL